MANRPPNLNSNTPQLPQQSHMWQAILQDHHDSQLRRVTVNSQGNPQVSSVQVATLLRMREAISAKRQHYRIGIVKSTTLVIRLALQHSSGCSTEVMFLV